MIIINTLLDLLTQYEVEIPIVQRDYAQGRSDRHSISVRQTLLLDMRTAMEGGPILDLNFIYGKTDGGKFIPLDGQQRLTTLLLLHIYAFANDETKTKLLKKFTYETRVSSREFLKKLVEHRASVFSSIVKPSDEIADSDWYQPDWDNDPTVQSVKIVLDDIVRIMSGIDVSAVLSNHDYIPIQFNFLPMDELGMEDSIYIKMNARGRMLTPFENYKAQLISRVQRLWEEKVLDINPHDFEHLMDGKWTDLFWSNRRNDFDSAFKNFFDILFTNFANSNGNHGYVNSVEVKDITAQMVKAAYFTLNYLCNDNSKGEAWDLIFNCLGGQASFLQRVMFFSVSEYMLQAEGNIQQSLYHWIRIIRNITNNTNEQAIGRAENFGSAIQSIVVLSAHWNNLLGFFANETINLKIFSPIQIDEERIKASLILRSEEFSDKILHAEKHVYFSGQLRSALVLTGVTYEVAKGEEETLLKERMLLFDTYWSKISALFNDKEPVFGTLMRQALLTHQDYTLTTGSYYSFGVDNPNDAVSLKALFADITKSDLIRVLLDSFTTSQLKDIKSCLQNTIINANIPENDWRYCFIKYPDLFKLMNKQYLRIFKGASTLIVKNIATNGYNFEIFTYTLYLILKSKKIKCVYFYTPGSYGDHYVTTTAQGKPIDIRYKDNRFIVYDADKHSPEAINYQSQKEPLSEIIRYLENSP